MHTEITFPFNSLRTRGGTFYCVDTRTGNRTSLQIAEEDEARYAHIRRVAIPS
jgi:hypothetical protein